MPANPNYGQPLMKKMPHFKEKQYTHVPHGHERYVLPHPLSVPSGLHGLEMTGSTSLCQPFTVESLRISRNCLVGADFVSWWSAPIMQARCHGNNGLLKPAWNCVLWLSCPDYKSSTHDVSTTESFAASSILNFIDIHVNIHDIHTVFPITICNVWD